MSGNFDTARALLNRGRSVLRELGQGVHAASTALDLAVVEWLAGDLQRAERDVRADYEFLERRGETFFLSTLASLLARLVREHGRDDEALALTQTAESTAADDDVDSQVLWRSTRAPILARAGALAAAEDLARSAVGQARQTEVPVLLADTLVELASVLGIAGRSDEAREAFEEAIALYTAKGDRMSAARAKARAGNLTTR
jgi:tetratricopeptide (TPR) repeat protein